MSGPRSGFYGAIARKENPAPCTPDCERRSAVCHMAGNCPEHDAWRESYAATLEEVKRRYSGERGFFTMMAEKRNDPRYRMVTQLNRKSDTKNGRF